MCHNLTLMFPPPGEWLTLSMEPTLDWAFSLKLTLWDSIFTSPPPAAHMDNQYDDHAHACTDTSWHVHEQIQLHREPLLHVKSRGSKSYVLFIILTVVAGVEYGFSDNAIHIITFNKTHRLSLNIHIKIWFDTFMCLVTFERDFCTLHGCYML